MFAVGSARHDPAADRVDLGGGELFVGIRGGHDLLGILGKDALHHGAVGRVAGFDRLDAVFCCVSSFWGVEAEIGLAFFCIEPVAREAVVREDGADVSAEVDGFIGCAEDCSWDESGDDEEGGEKRRSDHDGVGGVFGVL